MQNNERQELGKQRKIAGHAADILFLILLSAFAFYVNRDIVIKGLYMDDLYMWSCYGEQSLWEFAFPIGTSTRFRPVYWLATYLQMAIVGNHISWFVPFNIICNIAAAASIYYMIVKISRYRVLGLLSGICYLASRFAYYQIGQALGLMETMALVMALWILYLMYRYINAPHEKTEAQLVHEGEDLRASAAGKGSRSLRIRLAKSGDWRFALGLGLYFLLVFTHERYLALLPVFYFAFFCRFLREEKPYRRAFIRENKRWLIAPAVLFAVIFVIRTLCIGSAIPAGTGGTEVTDTFNLREALSFAVSQVLYIFGVNAGPEHLNGLPWEQTPALIKTLTKVSLLALFVICAMFALTQVLNLCSREKADRRRFWRSMQNVLLFLLFLAMCIGCSSITIRVEMRWIYVSYAAALLVCAYMIGEIVDNYRTASAECGKTGERRSASNRSEAASAQKADAKAPAAGGLASAAGAKEAQRLQAGKKEVDEPAAAENVTSGQTQSTIPENVFSRAGNGTADRLLTPPVVAGVLCTVFLIYTLLSVSCNVFYRQYFPKLYFWPDQLRMNSLAEETWEKYGEDLFGKDIYILGNSYEMSDFYKDTFFKTFDKDKKAEGTQVHFAETAADIPKEALRSGNLLVIEEVPEENAYQDVTQEVLAEYH